jgi:hypothetical protein
MTPKTTALFAFGECPITRTSDLESVGNIFERIKEIVARNEDNFENSEESYEIKPRKIKNDLLKVN